jgi:hypothetical protein
MDVELNRDAKQIFDDWPSGQNAALLATSYKGQAHLVGELFGLTPA